MIFNNFICYESGFGIVDYNHWWREVGTVTGTVNGERWRKYSLLAFKTHGTSYSPPYKLILAWNCHGVYWFSPIHVLVFLFTVLCILCYLLIIIFTVMYNSSDDILFGTKCLTLLLFTLQVESSVGPFLWWQKMYLFMWRSRHCQKTVINMVTGITVAFLTLKVLCQLTDTSRNALF